MRSLFWIHLRRSPPESYVLPLPGLRIPELEPSFGAPRPLGPHEGIDLPAPAGTPVLAVAEGIVVRDRPTRIGGNVAWILGSGRQLYYYAHLRELTPGLRKGRFVEAGERLGSVGNTGNAAETVPHLHFAIYRVTSDLIPLRYAPIDSYPLLVARGRSLEAAAPVVTERKPQGPPDTLAIPVEASAALALAPGEIAQRADATAQRLAALLRGLDPFLGIDADTDVRRVQRVYDLPSQLQRRAGLLKEAIAPDEARPLAELGVDVRAAGMRLDQRSRRLELLLQWYESCEPRALALLLGALETIALGLETDAPAADVAVARADYFFFEGRRPGIVPPAGGWLVVVGEGLWRAGAPRVALLGPDGEGVLAQLEPHRLHGGDALATHVATGVLEARGGACLFLRVSGAASSTKPASSEADAPPARLLPLCVPESHASEYRIAAGLSYRLSTARRILETDEVFFTNSSCDAGLEVSKVLEWELHTEGRLVDMGESEIYAIGESSIDCRIDGNRILCAGRLGAAECEAGASSGLDAEWHHIFSPAEEYPDPGEYRSAGLGSRVEAGASSTEVCVEVPRERESAETLMWFDLLAVNAHQHRSMFSSPREEVTGLSCSSYAVGPHRIDAELDPERRAGMAAICVTIRSPECGD